MTSETYFIIIIILFIVLLVVLPIVIVAININNYWDDNPNVYDKNIPPVSEVTF